MNIKRFFEVLDLTSISDDDGTFSSIYFQIPKALREEGAAEDVAQLVSFIDRVSRIGVEKLTWAKLEAIECSEEKKA